MKSRLVLLVSPLFAAVVDCAVTIMYQPAAYWAGNLDVHDEVNPVGKMFLQWHQSGIFILSALWLLLVAIAIIKLPIKFSFYFSLIVVMCHTLAASSWLLPRLPLYFTMGYAAFNAILYLSTYTKYQQYLTQNVSTK